MVDFIRILAATPHEDAWRPFLNALAGDAAVKIVNTGAAALAAVAQDVPAPALLVVDEDLPDAEPLALVLESLRTNAAVNTAVATAMEEAAFHDASEGLGVLLQLPPTPGAEDASRVLAALKGVVG